MDIHLRERERLRRRILLLHGTDLSRELRRYRNKVNKLPEITKRGVRAFPRHTPKGTVYRAADEVLLCHEFLDKKGIDPLPT